MARPARFAIDCRVADATDRKALEAQLRDCDLVFHCVNGDSDTILRSAEAVYRATAHVGARRLVYLSSAVVHGTDPDPGTHDDSMLVARQPFEYNVSKVMAEHLLRRLRADRAVEVATLRPGIVFGPNSLWWTAAIARDLLAGKAYLVDEGSGICNTVYVDNLVYAMWLAAHSDGAANQDFIITDGEQVTWRDLYAGVARALLVDMSTVPSVPRSVIADARAEAKHPAVKAVAKYLIRVARQTLPPVIADALRRLKVKQVLREHWTRFLVRSPGHSDLRYWNARRDARALATINPLIASLQDCHYLLPMDKARRLLHYDPPVTFAEGSRMTELWLRSALGVAPQGNRSRLQSGNARQAEAPYAF